MATLREQLAVARQVAYFDATLNPRAVSATLFVGTPQDNVAATVVITERAGQTKRDEATGVTSTGNTASILIDRSQVADLPQVRDNFRGTCTTEDGTEWRLLDIMFQDDAVFRVKAIRSVITGAGRHRAAPWGG